MRAAALFIVLVAARLATFGGHVFQWSPWTAVAYLWHDAVVVVAFAALERSTRRRPRVSSVAYTAAAAYVAGTIPVVRVLGTPLTFPMWRAAGGALADSIGYYVTRQQLTLVGAMAAVSILAPRATRQVRPVLVFWLLPIIVLGPFAAMRIDTHGLDRNALTALALTAVPRLAAETRNTVSEQRIDWRAPHGKAGPAADLSWLRGAAAGRHIVLVGLESTAAQYLGLYGATRDPAPNLSQLAQAAVVFDHAYAVYPESIKGLLATLCSQYPDFDRSIESVASRTCRSAAAALTDRGYHTALFHSGRFAYLGMNAVVRGRGYQVLADAGDITGNRESSFGVDESAAVARMLQWIDSLPPGEPFFLTYLPIAGHHPYESSSLDRPFSEQNEFGRYRNAIHDGDAALGQFVRGLRDRGLYERTMWIVYGDHGEAFGQHPANYGHTFQLYEENVHVPFVIALPGMLRHTVRSEQVISLLDTSPTLLDIAGIAPPAQYRGASAIDGRQQMALFFADYSLGILGLRDGPNKVIYELESGRLRLFDVAHDAGELSDQATERPAGAEEYSRHLKAWIKTGPGG